MLSVVTTNKVCCVFVYNHNHDNIDKLQRIYGQRFSNCYHLIPFYNGDHPDVVPIYENSYTFQGYLAQSYKHIFNVEFSHYMFIADDLILNSHLNQSNLLEELTLDSSSGYLKDTTSLTECIFAHWTHALPAIQTFFQTCAKDRFVLTNGLLPSCEQAKELFSRHGLTIGDLTAKNIVGCTNGYLKCTHEFLNWLNNQINTIGYCSMPYPLAWAYSDFIIIPSKALQKFCYYCGIFAAMGLFVEIAIPTAMLLACEHIVTENKVSWCGTELWNPSDAQMYAQHRGYAIQRLLEGFEPKQLYVHPIKLSMWG